MENRDAKKTILVVDDDKFYLDLIRAMLENDFFIITLESGKEALDYLGQNVIVDLILLDIIMPDMDGWETLNQIRKTIFLSNIPIIFLTSLDATIKEQAIARGGADYITKPVEKKDLLGRIENVLGTGGGKKLL